MPSNERGRITGLLIYSRPFFIQCLEGRRSVVAQLLEKLYRDPRHAGIQIVSTQEIERREHEAWSMRLVRLDELESGAVRPICLRHGGDLPFDPNALREPQLLACLREMSEYIATQWADTPQLAV